MAAPKRKTRPGLPFGFPASFYNELVDVVRWVKSQKALGTGGQLGARKSETVSMLRNETPDDLPRGSVLELGDRLFDDQDFENLLGLEGAYVADQEDLRPVGIYLLACTAGAQAPAAIAGAAIARVNVEDVEDRFADPIEGDPVLTSRATKGVFQLLEIPDATGEKNLLVSFNSITPPGVFPVTMVHTGGADGTGTTQATWTYTVKDAETDEELETDCDPTADPHTFGARPNVGVCRKATSGLAYYLADGTLSVRWCDEVLVNQQC